MKNKKWIVLSLTSLFLIASFVQVTAIEIKENIPQNTLPTPGLMEGDEPLIKVEIEKNIKEQNQQVFPTTQRDDIVDLITHVDESIILGYEENLTSFGPRVTGETGCVNSAEYLYNEFSSMGLQVRYQHWNYGGYDSNNVEATLPGTDLNNSDIYIVCGHYDTVTDSVGADDDASGVVAVLVAAKIMSQSAFNNTIRFVAFSGEEEGLFGSYMYVQEAFNNGDDIKGVLNADMISFALNDEDSGSLKVYEDSTSDWLYNFTVYVNQKYDEYIGLQLIYSGWSWGSDHYYFWEYGYSAVFYHEYHFNEYYHSSEDTIAHMNLTYDKKGTRLIIATLAELAQMGSMNSPPDAPSISGPIKGKPRIEHVYSFSTTDPENNNIFYYIEWGDGTTTNWIGPYLSSEEIDQGHTWEKKGTYIIKAKAKDIFGAESSWSSIEISIPRPRLINDISLLKFLEQRYPNLYLLLINFL